MNQLVKINSKEISIKEYQGKRVVTLKDVDIVHERPEGTAGRNFRENKGHFIEGTDYFQRNSSEAKEEFNIIAPNGLILITESGYLMLVKSLSDDLAWSVQRELVNNYFRPSNFNELSPQLQVLISMELRQKQLEQDVALAKQETAAVKEEVNDIREVMTVNPGDDWRKQTNNLLTKICKRLNNYKSPKDYVYKALEQRAHCQLSIRLNNLKVRSLNNGSSNAKINSLNYLDAIAEDPRLIEIYVAIVKEMAVKNGINAN